MSPVNLRECMEEVVKYTLESHINGTLEFDLGLSNSFCSDLLKLDPNTTTMSGTHLMNSTLFFFFFFLMYLVPDWFFF